MINIDPPPSLCEWHGIRKTDRSAKPPREDVIGAFRHPGNGEERNEAR